MALAHMHLVLIGWAGAASLLCALWFVQRARSDAGVVDVGWAAALALLATFYACASDGFGARRALVALMAGAWGGRLALHLLRDRVLGGRPEDGRYRSLREGWGAGAQARFFLLFQANAALAVLLSLTFLAAMLQGEPRLRGWDWAGVLLWAGAVAGESAADGQLARFRADPGNRGRTCRAGLWRFSRHPNYFFEWLHWGAYPLLAWGGPLFPLALIGPALMLLLLWKVTGIAATEAHALATRLDYAEYQAATSAFIPWFPRGGGPHLQAP